LGNGLCNGFYHKIEMNKPISFIGKSGRFYIQNALNSQRFAMYDNPTSYSEGLQIPSYISIEFARKDFFKLLKVTRKVMNLQQVQSIPPASPKKGSDHDSIGGIPKTQALSRHRQPGHSPLDITQVSCLGGQLSV